MMGQSDLNRCCFVEQGVQFRLCPYLFCFVLVLQYTVLGENGDALWRSDQPRVLNNLDRYEITYPQWLNPARHKISHWNIKYPSEAEVKIAVGGVELVLQLQRNEELLAPGYQEIWYSPNGDRRFSRPSSREHCYYHGAVRGIEDSSVVLSTCAGLRGMIAMNHSVTYMIEPLANHMVSQGHAVFRAESLKITPGTCGHPHDVQNHTDKLQDLIGGIAQANRWRRDVSRSTKYVEFMLVADQVEFVKHGRDLEKTKRKLLEAANYVDKYYKALNIRVALIWLEIWNKQNKINVTDNPYSTLGAFLTWRRKQLLQLPNDNAQLVTGVSFQGTTIGLAPLKAMCSEYQSGGVNSDHSENAVGIAATMAHEMGHNFGMSHDSEGCCQASPEDGGCIMAAATGHPFPRVFNPCNQAELKRYLNSGGGKCLFNPPNTKAMYGGQRCGNGYLEEGEECDCGEVEECSSPCCNAHNCTLKAAAECAHGVCCQDCKLKRPGVLCRPSSGSCDLPEYCDGKSESCPANFYLVDGSSCAQGTAYCYTGMCLNLEQQCYSLWGKDAQLAPDLCFTKVNEAGDTYGNCGKDLMGKYRGCKKRDAKCGKIQCLSSASKPIETNAVAIDTTIREGQQEIHCRGTHVYRPDQEEESQGDTLDPGLVMTGTKCGNNAICFDGECRNVTFLRADECNTKCHGRGLCNNNHNCHCDAGWAPPYCEEAGNGGSQDSGPVIPHRSLLPLLVCLPLFFFGLAVLFIYWCYRKKLPLLKSTVHPPHCICINTPASPKSKAPNGHANPTFQIKGSGTDKTDSQQSCLSGSPRSRHAIVRPTVKPPPIPAYALQQQSPVLSETTSRPHPSLPAAPRPSPPNRPPPPCPITKPSHIKEEVSKRKDPKISPAILQKGKSTLLPPSGHNRF
ncbi:disintegrin and metalloproteinase domain-containing protein 19 isoform X1 [Electrophorus electricus]|uniref:disintegrin and metalloproteinase domain-containing protein 19 isoform X1 n=1 Tax=Electrophorus electricus TaxID=8005 RepID=UPI0015D04FDA|nr:disintegrin and metalloproteinase domain-containing protein 19 isoform X1 [Electrophorus electricus]